MYYLRIGLSGYSVVRYSVIFKQDCTSLVFHIYLIRLTVGETYNYCNDGIRSDGVNESMAVK